MKADLDCIGNPNEYNQMGILDMTQTNAGTTNSHVPGSNSPTEATDNYRQDSMFKTEKNA